MNKHLVLFMAGNPNAITLAVEPEVAEDLGDRLVQIVRNGHTQTIAGTAGQQYVVNFSHVVIAYFE